MFRSLNTKERTVKQKAPQRGTASYPTSPSNQPRLPNTRSFGDVKTQSLNILPPFLTPEEKKELLENQTPFYIKAFRRNPINKFGESITFTVVIEGEYRALTLHGSIYREALLEALSVNARQSGQSYTLDQPVGPVVMAQIPNPDKTKNPIWDMVDPNNPEGISSDDEPIA